MKNDVGVGLRQRVGAANGDGDGGAGEDGRVIDAVANHQGVRGVVRFEQGEFVVWAQVAVVVRDGVTRGEAGDVGTAVAARDSEGVAGKHNKNETNHFTINFYRYH